MDTIHCVVVILSVLLLISEALAQTEKFKANSNLQAVVNILRSLKSALSPNAKSDS